MGGSVANTGQVLLGTYNLLPLAPFVDEILTLGPSSPSSTGSGVPVWLAGDGTLYEFGFSSDLLFDQVNLATPLLNPPDVRVPEPATLAIFAFGLVGLGFMTRRRRRREAVAA